MKTEVFRSFSRSWLLARNAVLEALPPVAARRGRTSETVLPGKVWK
jgi:hypothetical protein